ncbi:MAG TPA: KH domain-containing protein [Anaerolineae bacterium]|nr:KH domain-containing protein [Anaerolineae bacterium]HOR00661.1 KH domain-containing protein [Anaerolineae bacterium]HPL29047.1 KH domain-containing protein [Anaerolineae bacterium]
MQDLIEYMARSLVDHPEDVRVTESSGVHASIYELRVRPSDKGWVIGRQGRVANAMRTLLRVAAAQKRRRAVLEIM